MHILMLCSVVAAATWLPSRLDLAGIHAATADVYTQQLRLANSGYLANSG
jgi:hypothetical protein